MLMAVDRESSEGDEMRATSVQAGWYDDPWGHAPWRYWDGDLWTDATCESTSAAAPPAERCSAAALLRSLGYDVTTDVVEQGRSGMRHAIGVVGQHASG
jgi:hypothetical protein